jgi:molybdopterin-guanine dinucleotide biosynthesis protein A/nucleoside-triphosphatase THEP1
LIDQIYILSQPIQSGKTTLLSNWVRSKPSVAGILTPDIDGARKLYDISTNTYFDLQLPDTATDGIRIGRFLFDETVFKRAQDILKQASEQSPEWIVVDEIGRLEMDRKEGLEPEISVLIEYFKTHKLHSKLLLVIRDYLLEEAQKYYGMEEAVVLSKEFFQSQKQLAGLVLCGGQSVRMGRDKAFIKYHSKEQYAFVANQMKPFTKDVFISCNSKQQIKIPQMYSCITDSATYLNAGPMTGVLSAFEQLPDASLLVMGCDYPHFSETDMKALVDAREGGYDVVCYHHPESGFDEPLLAIYENHCASLLLHFYQKGNTSLQQFLKTVKVKRIHPSSLNSIKSIDTP